jgi:integrase/recombinase XerD
VLTLYRLHGPNCKRGYDRLNRAGTNCACPVHVEGKLGSEFLRLSTKTRSMELARTMVVEAEQRGKWAVRSLLQIADKSKPLSDAVTEFLTDRDNRLAGVTLVKYKTVLRRLVEFCDRRGLTLDALNFSNLTAFRNTWPTGPRATANNITRLKTFLYWCVKNKWLPENPAEHLEFPDEAPVEREPYTDEEMQNILAATRQIKLDSQQSVTNEELETFILLMRYSGMAISDAALLEKSELRGDEVRYYRNKTRRNARRLLVVVPLPPDVLRRVLARPLINGRYFFAHGTPTIGAQVEQWRKRLNLVFGLAQIEKAGSHRFRHTFATDLLTKGIPLELVSAWLGHRSVKITQQHYSHWVESRIQAASNVLRGLYS